MQPVVGCWYLPLFAKIKIFAMACTRGGESARRWRSIPLMFCVHYEQARTSHSLAQAAEKTGKIRSKIEFLLKVSTRKACEL